MDAARLALRLLVLVFVVGCTSSSGESASSIVGTWGRSLTKENIRLDEFLAFHADGTLRHYLHSSGGGTEITSCFARRYTFEGSTLTTTTTYGSGAASSQSFAVKFLEEGKIGLRLSDSDSQTIYARASVPDDVLTASCDANLVDPGESGVDDGEPVSLDVNPYDVPYPGDNTGWRVRSGTRRGNRIPNLEFDGYRPERTDLKRLSLARFYDPEQRTHDVLLIVVNAMWSSDSGQLLDAIHGSSKRIATLSALVEGEVFRDEPTMEEFATWHSTYPWATTVLDPNYQEFGHLTETGAVPFVVFVDTRTMEIAATALGAPPPERVDEIIDEITSREPSY